MSRRTHVCKRCHVCFPPFVSFAFALSGPGCSPCRDSSDSLSHVVQHLSHSRFFQRTYAFPRQSQDDRAMRTLSFALSVTSVSHDSANIESPHRALVNHPFFQKRNNALEHRSIDSVVPPRQAISSLPLVLLDHGASCLSTYSETKVCTTCVQNSI